MNESKLNHKLRSIFGNYLQKDLCLLSICILTYILLVLLFSNTSIHEDSYIILRYAENISKGYGFVWNLGEDWIWGSTSLTWTLILAFVAILGLPIISMIKIITLFLGMILLSLNYKFLIDVMRVRREFAFFGTLMISFGHLTIHTLLGFETILFSLLLYLNLIIAYSSSNMLKTNKINPDLLFLMNAYFLSFTRPEGLIICIGTYFAFFFMEKKSERKIFTKYMTIFIFLILLTYGITTILFSYPLPNTFYVKKGTEFFYTSSLVSAWNYYGKSFLGYLLIIYIVQIIRGDSKCSWKNFWLFFPYIVLIGSYFTIFLSQNVAYRFQYPIVPIIIVLSIKSMDTLLGEVRMNESFFQLKNF